MLDIIIRGGDVVTPQGVTQCDVAIAGETIAAIAAPDTLPAQSAGRVIEANGRIVMPGGIDPHVHLHHVWIKPDGTPLTTDRPRAGRPRRAVRGDDDVYRFRLLAGRSVGAGGHRGPRPRLRRQEPVRLGLPHNAALRAAP